MSRDRDRPAVVDPRHVVGDPRQARAEIAHRAKAQVGQAGKLFLEAVFGTNDRTIEIVGGIAEEVRGTAREHRERAGKAPIAWDFGDEPADAGAGDVIDVDGEEVLDAAPAPAAPPPRPRAHAPFQLGPAEADQIKRRGPAR